ncbi:MAG: LysM peptidoglycan-binding domain-containing protein [Clostridia bacterium]|nr:LysM peptidoglycan-binding domain-containing protein [Clostridia bacterium]
MFLILQAATNVSSYVPEESREFKTIVVSSGDTLWSIASEYADGDVRDKIKDIKKFNGLKSDILEIGSRVKVPLYD